ncbi:ethanolaminephosphotransferase, partial [Gregarina niphandrodes]
MGEYEYTVPTTSPFYRGVVSPACEWLVRRIPANVTPDAITWVGLLFAATAVLVMPLSRWLAAVCWVLYATADNLDGKHARATKQASVKGEFLDHVVDSATCSLLTIILAASTEGHYPPCAMLTLTVQVPFIIGCWYYYSTGRILLGCTSKGQQGPWVTVDEINYIAVPLLIALQPLWTCFDVYGIKL